MSIATQITRLQTAKSDIKSSIEAKGVTVPSSALIDDYAGYIDQISGGGGVEPDLLHFKNTATLSTATLSIYFNHVSLKNAQYSTNNTTWTSFAADSDGWTTLDTEFTYAVPTYGGDFYVKFEGYRWIAPEESGRVFRSNGGLQIDGTLNGSYYKCIFNQSNGIYDFSNLVFTSKTLDAYGLYYAFAANNNASFVPPQLPFNYIGEYGLAYTFYYCSNMTTAPALPAKIIGAYGCYYMFSNCSYLTTAPALPATTIGAHCYDHMFYYCTRLATAPTILPATTLAAYCYYYMFYECVFTTAPVLPALTLTSNCYGYMFYSCRSLNYIKAMFTTTPTTSYTIQWVGNVSSSGTFVKNTAATWSVTGTYGVPSGWTVQTASE